MRLRNDVESVCRSPPSGASAATLNDPAQKLPRASPSGRPSLVSIAAAAAAMAFTFAAFCYMLALLLTAALIFFAIWHVSAGEASWHPLEKRGGGPKGREGLREGLDVGKVGCLELKRG